MQTTILTGHELKLDTINDTVDYESMYSYEKSKKNYPTLLSVAKSVKFEIDTHLVNGWDQEETAVY